jgi:hypothetical protein
MTLFTANERVLFNKDKRMLLSSLWYLRQETNDLKSQNSDIFVQVRRESDKNNNNTKIINNLLFFGLEFRSSLKSRLQWSVVQCKKYKLHESGNELLIIFDRITLQKKLNLNRTKLTTFLK